MTAADGSGARRPGGRPSSLTPGTAAKILAAALTGYPFDVGEVHLFEALAPIAQGASAPHT